LNDVVVEETKEAGYSKAEEESRVIIVNDKLTNLSANSAEVNLEPKLNFHSLERIRQESGGSQMIGKKISLFKNNIKLK
jgi:hypothetical protein